jgi:hypothetical protein
VRSRESVGRPDRSIDASTIQWCGNRRRLDIVVGL